MFLKYIWVLVLLFNVSTLSAASTSRGGAHAGAGGGSSSGGRASSEEIDSDSDEADPSNLEALKAEYREHIRAIRALEPELRHSRELIEGAIAMSDAERAHYGNNRDLLRMNLARITTSYNAHFAAAKRCKKIIDAIERRLGRSGGGRARAGTGDPV